MTTLSPTRPGLRRLAVHVTRADLEAARACPLAQSCPVHAALTRQFPELSPWVVGMSTATYRGGCVVLPYEARRLAEFWDDTGSGYPLSFTLEVAAEGPPGDGAGLLSPGIREALG